MVGGFRDARLLLLGSDGPSGSSTSGTGVLTTDTELPVVSETPVGPDLLQLLNVVPQLLVDNVGDDVKVLSVGDILPPVQEPGGDLELGGVLHDGDDSLELIRVELSGTLVEVDIGLLADQVGVSTTNTLDLGQGEHDLPSSINVGVEQTENVLERDVGLRGSENRRHLEEGDLLE